MSTVYGTTYDLKEQRTGWSRQLGDYTEFIYEGTEFAIRSIFGNFRGNVDELVMGHRGALWSVTARISKAGKEDDASTVTLTLRGDNNRVQKSIFEPPFNLGITADEARIIREAVQNPVPGQSPALTNPGAINLYLLGMARVEFRTVNQRVLTVTRTAPVAFQWPNRSTWVDANLDHAQMIADAGINGVLNFTLPYNNQIPAPVNWNGILMHYGWLKHEPIYDTTAGDRSQETITYEFGLWPEILVPLAT